MLKLTKIVMKINGTMLLSVDFCLEKGFCLVVALLFSVHISCILWLYLIIAIQTMYECSLKLCSRTKLVVTSTVQFVQYILRELKQCQL